MKCFVLSMRFCKFAEKIYIQKYQQLTLELMDIQINKDSERIIVAFIGSLDTLAAQQAEEQVKEIEAMATMPITIDCTSLDYIASSGLRILLRIRKAAAVNKQLVTLCNVNSNIMEVLQMTHFDKMYIIK